MSRIATAQPSAARRRAVASPIPLAPPVITATRLAAMLVLLGFALLGSFLWPRSSGCTPDLGREHSNTPRPRSRPILPAWVGRVVQAGGCACGARRARVSAEARAPRFPGEDP